ncbi:MAG: hypothetical protein J6I73_04585 [Treponema sp.]|nr:hypothetical protein [Treponema sp.]
MGNVVWRGDIIACVKPVAIEQRTCNAEFDTADTPQIRVEWEEFHSIRSRSFCTARASGTTV